MPKVILIAYATNAGSTREVAESVTQTLAAAGVQVELRPASEVRSLDDYRGVVLGAPLYMFRWHRHAHQFLKRNRAALSSLPIAIFALGPWHNKEDELQGARDQLAKELKKHPWLSPHAVTVFVGKFDPAKLTFPYNLIPAMKNMPATDERDWDVIKGWVEGIAAQQWD